MVWTEMLGDLSCRVEVDHQDVPGAELRVGDSPWLAVKIQTGYKVSHGMCRKGDLKFLLALKSQ